MNKFRIKPFQDILEHSKNSKLSRSLGALDLVMLGIGCIIGMGIFVLTGVGAAKYAGPGIVLSFVLSGTACIFAALIYAELASMVPVSGSAYTYTYAVLGEVAAWIVGWNLVLEYAVSAGAVASGWSGYVTGIFEAAGMPLPYNLTHVPNWLGEPDKVGGIVNLPAILVTLFVTVMLVIGTSKSARFNMVLVIVKLCTLTLFLALAAPNIQIENWNPFLPYGWSGVATGAAIIFFAYIGFDAVSTSAEECKNPNRDLPIGLIGSLAVCTILYIAVAGTLTGIVSYKSLDNAEPLAYALRAIGYNFGSVLVAVGAIAGLTTVLLVLIYGQTRIFFAMSRDKLLPEKFAKVHPKFDTPYVMTVVTGLGVALVSGFAPLHVIAELSNIGTLSAFVMVAVGVMVLRKTQPDRERPFRCPAVVLVGIGAILSCGYLMISLPAATWERFGIWTFVGLIFYAMYGYRRSPLSSKAVK
ncbi:MAG: yfnA [Rickettsiaceae bacterium]|jgi:APA family basic amino acid/polyamine antiporter|nr:yfnA [Rickettsiaceae bacterium]